MPSVKRKEGIVLGKLDSSWRSALALAVVVFTSSAFADAILWWRFDGRYDSSHQFVTNMANAAAVAGTVGNTTGADSAMNGKVCSVGKWGASAFGKLGSNANAFPVQGDAFPDGTRLLDSSSGTAYPSAVKSMQWSGSETIGEVGTVQIQKEHVKRVLNLTNFTYEVFFKVPAALAARTDSKTVFPLVETGQDFDNNSQGMKFGLKREGGKLYPIFRCPSTHTAYSTGAGTDTRRRLEITSLTHVETDKWHHLALVVDGKTAKTAYFILDYNVVATNKYRINNVASATYGSWNTNVSHYSVFYSSNSPALPLQVGTDLYATSENASDCANSFQGEIAEFRVSDEVLAPDQLLRPLPDAPVDSDTLVYLPMTDGEWFGNTFTKDVYSPYAGILNASSDMTMNPKWWTRTTEQYDYLGSVYPNLECPTNEAETAGADMRSGLFSRERHEIDSSLRFQRYLNASASWNSGNPSYVGNVVQLSPKDDSYILSTNSFTAEWFFRAAPWDDDGSDLENTNLYSYAMLDGEWCHSMITRKTGKIRTQLVREGGVNSVKLESNVAVVDGKWHHFAIAYDMSASATNVTVWLDYQKIGTAADFVLRHGTFATPLMFGGAGPGARGFNGWLSNLRITKRALGVNELLRMTDPADSILWWRFNGSGTNVVNMANAAAVAGTATNTQGDDSAMNGTVKSVGGWGSGAYGKLGNNANAFPIQTCAFPAGTRIFDGLSEGAFSNAVCALSWNGDSTVDKCGTVVIQRKYAHPVMDAATFTCEAFFRIPAEAAAAGDRIYPIVETGEDRSIAQNVGGAQGFKFGVKCVSGSLYPYFRCASVYGDTDAKRYKLEVIGQAAAEPDKWHHLALVVDGKSSHAAWFVLDYETVLSNRIFSIDYKTNETTPYADCVPYDLNTRHGRVYYNADSTAGGTPISVGADLYATAANAADCANSFWGEIAELRFTPDILSANMMLRPMPEGPVDADTLVYLGMDCSPWFGNAISASATASAYCGILNAAPSSAMIPRWWRYIPGVSGADYLSYADGLAMPAAAADAAGNLVSGGSASYCKDPLSTLFSRKLCSGVPWPTGWNDTQAYVGETVALARSDLEAGDTYALPSASFTAEWLFKTAGWEGAAVDDRLDSYVMMYGPWCKVMVLRSTGKLLTRLLDTAKEAVDERSPASVADGNWHHYALTYDAGTHEYGIWLDYVKIAEGVHELRIATSPQLSFGGMGPGAQAFGGKLDNLRLTRRVLSKGEFLRCESTGVWYRFDEASGDSVQNVARPGTMDGTMAGASKPVRGADAFGNGSAVYDALEGAAIHAPSSLAWTAHQSGKVTASQSPGADLLGLPLTVEAFVCMPTSLRGTSDLYPIVQYGNTSDTNGWSLGVFKGAPYLRYRRRLAAGAGNIITVRTDPGNDSAITDADCLYDGKWHHVAGTMFADGTTRVYLDYGLVRELKDDSFLHGVYVDGAATNLVVGYDEVYTDRSFCGRLADLRVTGAALSPCDMLRPMPAGPVDGDTAVYLPMSDFSWFGSPLTSGRYAPYANILNGAPSAEMNPKWWRYQEGVSSRDYFAYTAGLDYPVMTNSAYAARVRGGRSEPRYEDGLSTRFFRSLASGADWWGGQGGKAYVGNVVFLDDFEKEPSHALPSGSFTAEWFFNLADWEGDSGGDSLDSCVMLYGSWCKIMVLRETGRVKTTLVQSSSTGTSLYSSAGAVVPGRWHHYALTYDASTHGYAVWLDYSLIHEGTCNLRAYSSQSLAFGGMGPGAQVFNGMLDNLRVTKRVLSVDEFLNVPPHGIFIHYR